MAEINWGLLQVPDIGGNALAAFHKGREIREERDKKAAWSAYAANPNEQNLNALAPYAPKEAIALRQDAEKRRREMMAQDLQRKAVAGDPAALAQLSGIDLDAWSKVDARQKAQIKEQASYIGNAALAISRLPPQQQAAAWDAAAQQGSQLYPELAQQVGKFSPQALQAALANSNMISKFIEVTEPKYQVVPKDADLVNTRDPKAVQEFGRGETPAPANIPPSAIDYLKKNPALKGEFDKKYGAGSADRVLGGQTATPSGTFLGDFRGIPGERVTSGYRTPAHNKAVGGVGNSFHQRKDAQGRPLGRDSVPPPGMSMAAYHAQLVRLNPDKDVINEGNHVHMEPRT